MSDETSESTQENTETQALPTPAISGNSGGSQTSTNDFGQLIERIDNLEKGIPAIIENGIRSTKDKRFSNLEKLTGDFETMSAYLKAANGDAALAARNYKVDQLLNQPDNSSPASAGTGKGNGERRWSESKVTELLDELEVEPDEPFVSEWRKGEYASDEAIELALRRARDKARKQATTSGAPAFDGAARTATPAPEKEQRKQTLYAEKGRLQMNRHVPANAARLAEIDAELKRLG